MYREQGVMDSARAREPVSGDKARESEWERKKWKLLSERMNKWKSLQHSLNEEEAEWSGCRSAPHPHASVADVIWQGNNSSAADSPTAV